MILNKVISEITFVNEYEQSVTIVVTSYTNNENEEIFEVLFTRNNWDGSYQKLIQGCFSHEELCQLTYGLRKVTGI